MRIVDRHMLSVAAWNFAYAMAALLAIFSVINLTEELRATGSGGYGIAQALTYVLLRLPAEAYELFPSSAVLGTVLGLGQLQRDYELVALQAAGVSPTRLAVSVLILGGVLAATGAFFGEWIAAPLSQRAQAERARYLSDGDVLSSATGLWLRDGPRFVNVGQVQPDGSLTDLYVFDVDYGHGLRRLTHAAAAVREDGRWKLDDVRDRTFEDASVETHRLETDTWQPLVDPGRLRMLVRRPEDLGLFELYRSIAWLRQQRQNPLQYEMFLWRRLGVPLYTALMVMLALPVVLAVGPRVQIGAYVLRGALLGIGFQMFQQMFTNVALVAALPPLLTLVTPAAVAIAAVAVLYRVDAS